MNLSLRGYSLLRDIQKGLRRESSVGRSRSSKVMAEIEAWCVAHDIELGMRRSVKTVYFDRELIAQIDGTLAALGQPRIKVSLSGLTSVEQARHGNREAKAVRQGPRDHRILISLPASAPRIGLVPRPRDYLDLDRRDITLTAFDVLVQVENLDSFYTFTPPIPAMANWPRSLVVYRGDSHYGSAFAALAKSWVNTGKPHLYAGDFDAAGVGAALSSHATHLLLPPLEWLKQHATAEHLPAQQMQAQTALRAARADLPSGCPLLGFLALIIDEQRGLKQQWLDKDLTLVPLG